MDQQLDEPDLRSYLGVIWRRKWIVLFTTLVFLGVATALSVVPDPLYEAQLKVQLPTGVDISRVAMGQVNGFTDTELQAIDQIEVLDSLQTRYDTIAALPEGLPSGDVWKIRVEAIPGGVNDNKISGVAEVSLVSADPDTAAQILQIFGETYVAEVTSNTREETFEVMTSLGKRVDELRNTIAGLEVDINNTPEGSQQQTLVSQLQQAREDFNSYSSQLDKLSFGLTMPEGPAAVLGSPLKPTSPVSPNLSLNIIMGVGFGLFLGVAAAFLRDHFDDSVKSKDVVEQVTGVPTLGLIPRLDSKSELVAANAPNSAAAEAFRSLRTAVKFLSVDREVRVVQVTSPSPGEGKTVTAINLATVFAQAGDRVVLVSGDLRRPRAEEILGVPSTPGITGVLIGEVALPQAIRAVEGLPNLSVLPSGYPPPNPSELLSGERARRLVDVLAQTYDIVIVDSPPVLPVTDAQVISRMADTTLVVASAKTSRRSLDRCTEMLNQVDAPLMGTVLTQVGSSGGFTSGGYDYQGKRHRGRSRNGGNGYGGPSEVLAGSDHGTLTGQHPLP